MECARALAVRTLAEGGSRTAIASSMHFAAASATPTEPEIAIVHDLPRRQTERFEKPRSKPWDLAVNDPGETTVVARRCHARTARGLDGSFAVLLNLDETITKE